MHFIEASAATLAGGGWEIFILMEYCRGGGLIDFLNSRLHHRLSETEVLSIFCDVCQGVQVLHHLDPVLVHRDLKIENVLLSTSKPPRFKLCDFGSCMPVLSTQPARSADAIRRLELDLQQHTTMPYRAPEMIDLGQHVPITEKADIWALGVLLYKLCYYTTPFEAPGTGAPAIMQARYDVPAIPAYSRDLQDLIRSLLQVRPEDRPDIDTLLRNVQRKLHSAAPSPEAEPPKHSARPESLILNVDEAATRFPSVDELSARVDPPRRASTDPEAAPPTRSVRAMVAEMNSSTRPSTQERPLPVSILMEPSASSPGGQTHTLVDVDVSSSSDEEPEDAGATFRVRVRPSGAPHPPEAPASTVPNAAEALHDLLVNAEADADRTAESVVAPETAELDSLAEHERALQELLKGDQPAGPSRHVAVQQANSAPCTPTVHAPPAKPRKPMVRPKPAALSLSSGVRRSTARTHAMPVPLSSQTNAPTPRASAMPAKDSSAADVPTDDLLEMNELPAARRAPRWDESSPPPKTYVDASTSPRRPTQSEPAPKPPAPTHGIDASTTVMAPTPRHAVPLVRSTSAQNAAQAHARGVRLTKRATQESDKTPVPVPAESTEGVSALIQKWQSQAL